MAAGDMVYGTPTALSLISNANSLANNAAKVIAVIDNSTTLALDYIIHVSVPLTSSNTAGTLNIRLLSSLDNTNWTDTIDVTSSADQAAKIVNARLVRAVTGIYVATHYVNAQFHFTIRDLIGECPKYFAIILKNSATGAALGTSGAAGFSQSIKIATS